MTVTATKDHQIELTEEELDWLLADSVAGGYSVDVSFESDCAALRWPQGEQMPPAVARLADRRTAGGAAV